MKKKDKPPNVNKWKWTSLSLYQNYNIIVRKVYPKRLLSTVFWLFISRAHDWNEVKLLSRVWRCGSMDYRAPGFSIMGFSRQEFLEWVAISFSRGSSRPRDQTQVSRISGRRFTLWVTREALWLKTTTKKNLKFHSVILLLVVVTWCYRLETVSFILY